jgi:hypothetical protein
VSKKARREAVRINKSLAAAQGDHCALLSIFSSSHPCFNDVCFATLMSRLGRLPKRDAAAAKRDERYRTLLAMLPAIVQEGGAQAISNITHALAKLEEQSEESGAVLDAVEERADWFVDQGSPQNIANAAWAFAALNRHAPVLFSAIDERADWLVRESEPQHVANTAWAFATLRLDAPALFPAINERAHWLVNQSKPQAVSNTAWAFATLGIAAPTLFSAIDARAEWFVQESKPQEIANTLWAFATLRRDAPALVSAIEERADWLVRESDARAISNTAMAFAELSASAPNFWACLERRGEAFAARANVQDVCTTAWALAVGGRTNTNSGLLRLLWGEAMAAGDGAISAENVSQLMQVGLHAQGDGVKLQSAPDALKQKMLETAADTTLTSSGRFEDRVARYLTDLGLKHTRQYPALGAKFAGYLAVDFAVQANDGAKTVLECDGPLHYLHGPLGEGAGRETGPTVAKRRLLERRGWRVVNLPWFQFRKLLREGGGEAVKRWLAKAIK